MEVWMKLKRIRNIAIATALAALAVVPAVGANASSSSASLQLVQTDIAQDGDSSHLTIAPCSAVGATTSGSTMTVAVEGTATGIGAVATRIGCGIVQGGRRVYYVQNALPGPVAATAGSTTIALAPYTVCADVYALFPDGTEVRYNRCPAY
jgi:hypothetical protein